MFLVATRTVGLALEASPYSYPQSDLSAGDFDFKPYNVKYSVEIEEAKRQYALGHMSALSSIMGKRHGTISFSVDMAWSGTVSTAPEWGKLLKACGWAETAYTTTGIGYTPSALCTAVPCVVEALETAEGETTSQLAIQLRGAMGKVKMILDSVGKPFRLDFEFTGPIQTIEDRANAVVRRPASYDTTTPEPVLSAAITLFSETLDLDKVTIDCGAEVSLMPDPAAPEGYVGAHITKREPKGTFDPYLASISSRGHWSRITNGTTGALSIEVGSNLVITAPAAQIIKGYDGSDRSGAAVNTLECIFCTASTGNDEIEILQGAKA